MVYSWLISLTLLTVERSRPPRLFNIFVNILNIFSIVEQTPIIKMELPSAPFNRFPTFRLHKCIFPGRYQGRNLCWVPSPLWFEIGDQACFTFVKSLYGSWPAPHTLFEELKVGLEERSWQQSMIDPCLFLKWGIIYVVHVCDTIFTIANPQDLDMDITALGISTLWWSWLWLSQWWWWAKGIGQW